MFRFNVIWIAAVFVAILVFSGTVSPSGASLSESTGGTLRITVATPVEVAKTPETVTPTEPPTDVDQPPAQPSLPTTTTPPVVDDQPAQVPDVEVSVPTPESSSEPQEEPEVDQTPVQLPPPTTTTPPVVDDSPVEIPAIDVPTTTPQDSSEPQESLVPITELEQPISDPTLELPEGNQQDEETQAIEALVLA